MAKHSLFKLYNSTLTTLIGNKLQWMLIIFKLFWSNNYFRDRELLEISLE